MTTTARELSSRLADLLCREHSAMADFLVALSRFDRERRWEQLGYPSLFSFLRRELRLSAGAAQYRKSAAELVQRYPEVEAALRDGELCLSSAIELAKVITPENAAEVLPRFFGLSSRDAAAVAVSIRPVENPPMRELVTALPAGPAPAEAVRAPEVHDARWSPAADPSPCPPPPPTKVVPLSAELRRLNVTVSCRLLEKLEAARAALSHSRPGASTDQILEVGLDLILERHAKRRGLVKKPRPPKTATAAAPDGRGTPAATAPKREPVPAHVKRAVWLRDGGRCQWPLEGGGRLRVHSPARDRSPRPGRAGRPFDARQLPPDLPSAQRPRRPAGLRGRAHGPVQEAGPAAAGEAVAMMTEAEANPDPERDPRQRRPRLRRGVLRRPEPAALSG